MKDIKISDKLLSWVLGCDCEFKHEYSIGFCFTRTSKENKPLDNKNIEFRQMYTGYIDGKRAHTHEYYINIHTFIHLAKIKAFECGYEITQNAKDTNIVYKTHKKDRLYTVQTVKKYKTKKEVFKIENVIEALEWVAEKVGGEGEL